MLILTRRIAETLVIGGEVTVTILQAHGDRVRIGVNAPREMTVRRKEAYGVGPPSLGQRGRDAHR